MSENDSARRVVLLARPGPARDRMREALAEAAAVVVLEADPTVTDPSEVSAARPDVALIVLDAATDEALDRFDALLSDPGVEVLFEEAELAVGRAGWDAARWVRHLAAKLHRSGNVLPPGQEAATETALPSAPVTTPPAIPADAAVEPATAPAATQAPEWSLSDLQVPELPTQAAEAVGEGGTRVVMPELETTAFDMPELPPLEMPGEAPAPARGFESTFDVHGELPSLETEAFNLAPLQLDEEFLATSGERVEPLDLQLDIEPMPSATDAGSAPPPPLPTRFELELVDDTPAALEIEDAATAPDEPARTERFQNDLADLHSRIASMELVVDRPATRVHGAVLVLAGIGGPDAVRQLLGALPGKFPRAVLVQQRLDGGHYDKLVAQMQRATQLVVELAVPGKTLQPSSVYILPPTVGVETGPGGLSFTDAPGDLLASLPAGDSAVLMLSGSDPNLVDAVMKLSVEGALVAAQALDGCYDVAAPAALASRGGTVAKPQDLARRLAERWDG